MKIHLSITALLLLILLSACSAGTKKAIFTAVDSGNTQQVARLLAEGTDVNVRDASGYTPLLVAALHGHRDMAEQLIRAGADVNAKGTNGWTPLLAAVASVAVEKQAIVELLIAKGADINTKNNAGNTPLYVATMVGSAEVTALLIAKGANVNTRNMTDATPLHVAANKGVAEILIAKGADIKARSIEGVTPLYSAARMDLLEVAALLIARGAEVDARTKGGYTPLRWVALHGNRDFAKLLIDHGADVNAKDNGGTTPLIATLGAHTFGSLFRRASQHGGATEQEILQTIQRMTQSNAAELKEMQEEIQKAKGQWPEVVQLLIDHGADIRADLKQTGSGMLLSAANLGSKGLVEALITYGADINDTTGGETALHGAIAEKHRDVAELLINKGTDLTLKSRGGWTPLHFLARHIDDQKLAELMVKHGADINARGTNGETPLSFATRAGNDQVARVLREHGGK